jgi:hypothetical protein
MLADDIGTRGEALLVVLLTDLSGREEPLFRPRFLGEKCPTVDHLVELVGVQQGTPFFFTQVKTTRQGYTKSAKARRLKVQVPQEDIDRLLGYPAPTYVIGIEERERAGYILSVNEPRGRISSLPTKYPLNGTNLELLWAEVRDYWAARDMVLRHSHFSA